MKKINYLIVFVFCLCLFPMMSKAECSDARTSELSKIASNVRLSYNYVPTISNQVSISYAVTLTNLTNDIYVKDSEDNVIFGTGERVLNYSTSGRITYNIYSNDANCKNVKLFTQYVNLLTYNDFAETSECQEHPDFKYCKMWDNLSIDTDEFYDEYDKYLDDRSSDDEVIASDDKKDVKDIILDYKNDFIIGLIGILVIIALIIIRRKKVNR